MDVAGPAEDRKGWLFRTARGHNGKVPSDNPTRHPDAWRMIRRRAIAAGSPRGQAPNPGGKGGAYHEMQRLAREFTPRATEILRDIADDPNEDSRNRIVAIGMLFDRAWGKPREYDPQAEARGDDKSDFDPRDYTPQELDQIEAALRLMLRRETEAT